jgi:hypothetical protein
VATLTQVTHHVGVDADLCLFYTGAHISRGNSMRRVIVRRSSVHGKGVFAMRPLAAGERVLEYKGEMVPVQI